MNRWFVNTYICMKVYKVELNALQCSYSSLVLVFVLCNHSCTCTYHVVIMKLQIAIKSLDTKVCLSHV